MGRILLCDHDEALLLSLSRILEAAGHTVTAGDGPSFLSSLRAADFDLVITDLRMPEVDGFQILAAAKEHQPPIPVIATSGSSEIPDAVRAMGAGARDFLIKPFEQRTLEEAVRAVFSPPSEWLRGELFTPGDFLVPDPVQGQRPLRVFICHSSNDKVSVRALCERLSDHGIDPWLDERNLLAGQEWDEEIPKAVRNSDVVVVCLSAGSVVKKGYLQKELRVAIDAAQEEPEGSIFLIPARLEDCGVPDRLRRYQWVDLFDPEGFDRLLRSLRARANSLRGARAATLKRPETVAAQQAAAGPPFGRDCGWAPIVRSTRHRAFLCPAETADRN